MKSKFSTHWNASIQPRKQRKYLANAPLHLMHKFLSAQLSESLKQKHGKRSLPVRKGDEVLVMRGNFRKKKAKISSVDMKNQTVILEGIQRTRKDGTKVNVPFNASNLQIQTLNTEDKKRFSEPQKQELKEKETKKEKK